ncbi:FAD binding domain-containing protein [Mycobacterium conspicuum]|jgi:carbon-monoxide dehydrogenase medium subunit|uniref:Carbon monoxide dehydrogenase n=1 Tax=Mycobacterium conspicuum TaxID=44010 RepID=A0A1X1THN7_9MYCO|nr:xanthine dehydrogenase family protein subunit M [Mycobacterium conspicuum]ORV44028.1 molybdopterin dehydrogenase [Mycobacterium conspicuum]BBZ38095.1 carbon monoxide dehydrogenase [Mycobacterium conspicuum]
MAPFDYHRPDTVDEAVVLLETYGGDGKVLAGGQSLLPVLALRLTSLGHLIDIGRVQGLQAVDVHDDGAVFIGAAVTHARVEKSDVLAAAAPAVVGAMPYIGHRAIRSRGTVCGSLAHADPAAELPAVALAVGAEMTVRGPTGQRTVSAADFFEGYLSSALAEDELLVDVRFPAWGPRAGWSVLEVSRRHGDYALVGLVTTLEIDEAGLLRRPALSFFGVAGTPVRAAEAEKLLDGKAPDPALFAEAAKVVSGALEPRADDHASSEYRAHVAGVLTRRGLAEATERAGV